MKCPQCGSNDLKVIESREAAEQAAIRRRRHCQDCDDRFTTYERVERPNLAVIKRSGERELYDRAKLMSGILRATEKRPVSRMELERLLDSIERKLHQQESSDVPTSVVGEMILEELASIDPVAYIRFASVYKDFSSVDSFEAELRKLKLLTDKTEANAEKS
jgi:transcriptional repressor NrdR